MEIKLGIEIRVQNGIVATILMDFGDNFGSKKSIKSQFESDLERI